MIKSGVYFTFFMLFISCNNSNKIDAERNGSVDYSILTADSIHYSITVLKNIDSTFGYQINKNNEVFIVQKSIPAISGNNGFKDSSLAKKCGNIVVNKLKNKVFPPSITNEELKSILK